MEQTFPQFRKYSNNKVFFRIDSPTEFTELNLVGESYMLNSFRAGQLPERNFIADLLSCAFAGTEALSSQEFEDMLEHCKNHCKELSSR